MGTGIAMVFANAGIPVSVIDVNPEQVERGKKNVSDTYAAQVKKGRMTEDKAKERVENVSFVGAYDAIADADLVIEAVFESMAVKKEVFAALDKAVKKDAILASNTSTLDIDEIASVTSRPEKVVGLHFFAPANIMQLLEVVRVGLDGSPDPVGLVPVGESPEGIEAASPLFRELRQRLHAAASQDYIENQGELNQQFSF